MHSHQYGFIVRASRGDEFPLDMLRYDEAWPASTSDATMIAILIRRLDTEIEQLPRWTEVHLCSRKFGGFNAPRWASFLCTARFLTAADEGLAFTRHDREPPNPA